MRRPDGVVTQERLDELSTIKGHLIPVYVEDDIPGREPVAALTPEDFHKVLAGYACGNGACLADFGGIYRLRCPVCYAPTGRENMAVDVPPMWAEHERTRENPGATSPFPKGPMNPDEWIARIQGNPEGDHTTISKLKKRRR